METCFQVVFLLIEEFIDVPEVKGIECCGEGYYKYFSFCVARFEVPRVDGPGLRSDDADFRSLRMPSQSLIFKHFNRYTTLSHRIEGS